ncbi:Copia protein [Durusdinium trenchii]|uniref:Copia protein n=1 Tax=Durusdinium trenchii TaxID=1381693 RepID=A0ABP0I408_9DINO
MELLSGLGVLGFAWIMNNILQFKAELRVESGNVATQLSAASSLLRLTCDAVIELDNELRLIEDSPELACMLLTLASPNQ